MNITPWLLGIFLVDYAIFIVVAALIFVQWGIEESIIGEDGNIASYKKALLSFAILICVTSFIGIVISCRMIYTSRMTINAIRNVDTSNDIPTIIRNYKSMNRFNHFILIVSILIMIGIGIYLTKIRSEIDDDISNKESNKLNGIILAVWIIIGLTSILEIIFIGYQLYKLNSLDFEKLPIQYTRNK